MSDVTKRTVRVWLLVAIIVMLGCVVLWLYDRVNTLENRLSSIEVDSLRQLSITVSSLDRNQGRPGQYFQFDVAQFDELFGKDGWSGRQFIAVVPRQGLVEPVRLWVKGSEDRLGFGRTENDLPEVKWAVGEDLIILY